MPIKTAEQPMQEYALAVLSIIMLVASIVVDFLAPGIYPGIGYVFAVMLTLYSRHKTTSILVAAGAAVAISISAFIYTSSENFLPFDSNRVLSLLGVVAALFFAMYVKNLKQKAEKGTKQIDSLFFHATEGIIITNRKGQIVLVNPCAEQMFGYEKNELNGKTIDVLLPRPIQDKHASHRQNFHQHPSNRAMGVGRDLYGMKKDGRVFPVEISLSHYNLDNEAFVTAFIIDITVRKRHDEELKKLNADLEMKISERTTVLRETMTQLEESKEDLAMALKKEKELGDLKSRFVSTVSHEFRTPLSTIITSASLAKSYTAEKDIEKREKHLTRIEDAVIHLNGMLEDLLSLGKLDEGLVEIKPEEFDLSGLLSDFAAEMNETNRRQQSIVCNCPSTVVVNTDKRLLKNILLNLVSNAFKFSPPKAVIELTVNVQDDNFSLSVKDAGIGISEADQEHLFERFFRAQNATNIQGTGLGLHIVSKYLELMGGTIKISSRLNQGSTFTILLPFQIPPYEKNTGNRR